MIGDRRMQAALIGAHVGGHPLVADEHLDACRREPRPGGVPDERVRDAVEMPVDIDVVIERDGEFLPLAVTCR
jgi:hypothetical protein